LAAPLAAQDTPAKVPTASIAGDWDVSFTSPQGAATWRIKFEQSADTLWGTATTESLTAVMDRELDGLGSAMLTFVEKPGAPLVTVDLACDGDPSVTLRQERYVPLGSTLEAAGRWSVPVCARFGGEGWEASECWLLAESEKSFAVAGATSCPAWLIANRGGAGYYRVRHGSGLGDTLAATLDQASSSERTAKWPVRNAAEYAPSPMKSAWPNDTSPV